jgi:histidinol phosphatase-like PHP family hydrolase
MKIDLHVHTRERSDCAWASEEEQIQAAIAAGLDGIAITDHHRLAPPERLEALNRQYAPFRIFGGIEVTIQEEDFLVLGVPEPRLEGPDLIYPELYELVRARGGFIALAHPFRYHPRLEVDLDGQTPDAIEVYSPNTPPAAEEQIRELALRHGMRLLSNSDAHTTRRLGKYYNQLAGPVKDESELISLLKSGQFTLHVDGYW